MEHFGAGEGYFPVAPVLPVHQHVPPQGQEMGVLVLGMLLLPLMMCS